MERPKKSQARHIRHNSKLRRGNGVTTLFATSLFSQVPRFQLLSAFFSNHASRFYLIKKSGTFHYGVLLGDSFLQSECHNRLGAESVTTFLICDGSAISYQLSNQYPNLAIIPDARNGFAKTFTYHKMSFERLLRFLSSITRRFENILGRSSKEPPRCIRFSGVSRLLLACW